MWLNPEFPADLFTFTEEICNGKLHFLCSVLDMRRSHFILSLNIKIIIKFFLTPPIKTWFSILKKICVNVPVSLSLTHFSGILESITLNGNIGKKLLNNLLLKYHCLKFLFYKIDKFLMCSGCKLLKIKKELPKISKSQES